MSAKAELDKRLGDYIPDSIYVARQSRGNDTVVGWMIPHNENDPTYAAKKAKTDAWGKNLDAIQVSNVPRTHFSMIKEVQRSEFSRAVYWRCLHPDGFEFEISLANFEYLMDNYVISYGVLIDAELFLVYNKSNSKWSLIDKAHSSYNSAKNALIPFSDEHHKLLAEAKADEKASRKSIQPGDTFKWGSSTATFLGTMSVALRDEDILKTPTVIKRMKVFRTLYTSNRAKSVTRYHFTNQLTVHNIETVNPENYTAESAIDEVNFALCNPICYKFGNEISLDMPRDSVQPTRVWSKKPKQITQVVEPLDIVTILKDFHPDVDKANVHYSFTQPYLFDYDYRREHGDHFTSTLMIRNKKTNELSTCVLDNNRMRYYDDYVGLNYGRLVVTSSNQHIELCTYHDSLRISNNANVRRERIRIQQLINTRPASSLYQQMLVDFDKKIQDQIAEFHKEYTDKTWVANNDYDLVFIRYE